MTLYMEDLAAWSPEGFRYAASAVAVSIVSVEWIKSIVDFFTDDTVHFIVYNVTGFIILTCCLWFGRKTIHKKSMWFINGALIASLFMLWYASQFPVDEKILPPTYTVELIVVLFVCNRLRLYENPQRLVELTRARSVPFDG